MAEKKYVDLTGLSHYDEKIKAHIAAADAEVLEGAKDYADGLSSNYDAAGTAATAVAALENGQVKSNKEAIAKLNGDAETEGSVAKAVADAKTALEEDIASAAAAASAAQKDVADLEAYVGTIPEGASAESVVEYIDEKTAGIATDAALDSLTSRVATAEGKITTAEGEIDTLQADVDAVEASIETLVGTDTSKSVRTIANEELAAQLIPEDAQESLDTLQEIAAWIQSHPSDASAINAAIEALKTQVGDIPEDATASTIVAYIQEVVAVEKTRAEAAEGDLAEDIAALEAKFGEGEGSVSDMIADAVAEETSAREAAETAIKSDITALTSRVGAAESDVEELQTAIDEKASAADLASLTGRVDAAETDIDNLQAAIAEGGSVTAAITAAQAAADQAQADVDALETKVSGVETTVSGHTATLSSYGDRVTALENKVGDGFTVITNAEIDSLFNSGDSPA